MTNTVPAGLGEFVFELPLWFVVATDFTETDVVTGQRKLIEVEPKSFCGGMYGGRKCICALTDEDLATRLAQRYPGTAAVPLGANDKEELLKMLESFYPLHFDSVLFDPEGDGKVWKNAHIPIPEFTKLIRGKA